MEKRADGWGMAEAALIGAAALLPVAGQALGWAAIDMPAWWLTPWPVILKLAGAGAAAGAVWKLAVPNLEQTVNDRDAGTYLFGDQRTGKTTLASTWFVRDIRTPHSWTHRGRRHGAANARGAAWITTHGAADIAALVPPDRLTLFSPPRTPGVNIMAGRDPYPIASRVVTVVRRMYSDLGDNQGHLLATAAQTVAEERETSTLWDVLRFISDASERRNYEMASEIAQIAWGSPDKASVRGLANRLGDMLRSPRLARGLADVDGYDLAEEVRLNRVIIADLTQDDTADAAVLASALVNILQQVSVRRGPNAQMYPVTLDEFQGYVSGAIATWITEGGKRHMPLTLVHQNRAQIEGDKKLAAAALSCGTIVCMRVAIHDAREIASQLGLADPTILTTLPTRTAYARVLSHGRLIYRKVRVPYVDLARRADRRGRNQPEGDDHGPGKAGLLRRPLRAEDGTGEAPGIVPGEEAG